VLCPNTISDLAPGENAAILVQLLKEVALEHFNLSGLAQIGKTGQET
jgi:hypothetical protein